MKTDGLWKAFGAVFLAVLILYVVSFAWLSGRQVQRGPWQVAFQRAASGVPMLVLNQASLGITNVTLRFPEEQLPQGYANATVRFDSPLRQPPFGRLIFHDLMFLPGTITLDLFGHEVELLPRTLVLDRQEQPWCPNLTISLWSSNKLPPESRSPPKPRQPLRRRRSLNRFAPGRAARSGGSCR